MDTAAPAKTLLADYKPTPYVAESIDLAFQLAQQKTVVRSRIVFKPNPKSSETNAPLVLDGEKIELDGIKLNGELLARRHFALTQDSLTIPKVPQESFTLEIETTCNPSANSELSGLYITNGVFCTQCEAEGFRRITYFYDRPDAMTIYKVRIEADRKTCPVLLSNGNPGASGDLGNVRHFAEWSDPHPKPSYLFALVAGDLAKVEDSFVTRSGKHVSLGIYVEKGKEERCAWAMDSLKASMRWDEEAFGREYDLDVFNIVAVPAFNMGAMENKGLNIFNDKYILALPETATDTDYTNIEAIIGHEYFHNWSGNRITCRDWFQLCLKEGLTMFRDQEFTSDLRSRAVKRISDVKTLRARQFPEDGGPLAHAVRPSSYIEINNFYTPTVYEKGAEICRMMQSLIGKVAFRKAMDLYFARHDGEAAAIEDFVRCMEESSGRDLSQFFAWYEQAGTPHVVAQGTYDATRKTFALDIEQTTAPTPGQDFKRPLHMPLRLGLIAPDGEDMPLDLDGVGALNEPVIELREKRQTFMFRNVPRKPVVSINRGFTAPVTLTVNQGEAANLFLMEKDPDTFNRWEAGQTVAKELALKIAGALAGSGALPDASGYARALSGVLKDSRVDAAFKALMLGLPTEAEIAAAIGRDVNTDTVLAARTHLRGVTGKTLLPQIQSIWRDTAETAAYKPDPQSTARRSLRYAALHLLAAADEGEAIRLAREDLEAPASMTAEIGALSALVSIGEDAAALELSRFFERHGGDPLLVDKWLALNAQIAGESAAARIAALTKHPTFTFATPNRVYALIGSFTGANPSGFNAAHGQGYAVVADAILTLDQSNPQVAARIATGFRSWRMLDAPRRIHAQAQLNRIFAKEKLSRDTYEIVSRMLAT
ncbi:MAG: aminopeptidase N [Aestuariivirga sp.]